MSDARVELFSAASRARRARLAAGVAIGVALGVTALALGLAAGCARPKPSPVDEIVASHLAARGGEAKLKALRSIRESGKVRSSDGRVARVVREIERPDLYRLEFTYQGTTSVFAHDREGGWQVAPLQGEFEPRRVEGEQDAAGGADQRDLEGPLVGWREKGHKVELAGKETLPAGEAYKLQIQLRDGTSRVDYVDVASRQIVRSEVSRKVGGRDTRLVHDFSDFRDEGGIVFPHRIESSSPDRARTLIIVVEKVELDPKLEADRFRFPG